MYESMTLDDVTAMPHVREAVYEDCLDLAPRMRAEDVAEVWASSRSTPLESLCEALAVSDVCWTIIGDQGEVVGMFGVAPIEGTPGLPPVARTLR